MPRNYNTYDNTGGTNMVGRAYTPRSPRGTATVTTPVSSAVCVMIPKNGARTVIAPAIVKTGKTANRITAISITIITGRTNARCVVKIRRATSGKKMQAAINARMTVTDG